MEFVRQAYDECAVCTQRRVKSPVSMPSTEEFNYIFCCDVVCLNDFSAIALQKMDYSAEVSIAVQAGARSSDTPMGRISNE